ncbi:unnamed protein product [Malus baccata var. baccata]
MQALRSLFMCLFFLFSLLRISAATALVTITPSGYIRDGETLVSVGGSYELGFFSPGKSKSRYLGIWYTVSTDAVVWVANRETPLGDSSGLLKLTEQGVLVLLNSSNNIVWSSNSSRTAGNPVSQLLDSGNLVVQDGKETNPDNFLWQSFDYPCDTFLPEMKIGWDLVTGLERYISSWKSTEDPAPGEFSVQMDQHGLPQVLIMKGAKIQARGGSWNGLYLTGFGYGVREPNPISGSEFVMNKDEVYFEYRLRNMSVFSRYVLNPFGNVQRFTWVHQTQSWELSYTFQADRCENYALCGPFSSCSINSSSPICACLKGFVPKSLKDWNSGYWSDGCVRRTPSACSVGDGFLKYSGIKLPDTSSSWFDKSMSLGECNGLCWGNCSCTAYANLDIREGGSGCVLWFGNLIDIKEFTPGGGQDLYIRAAASELDISDHVKKRSNFNKRKLLAILLSSAIFLMGLLIVGIILYIQKKKLRNEGHRRKDCSDEYLGEDGEEMELPLGYMSPEYATDGTFSMKSDVFSLGVILLEMLSRKKNRGFRHPDHDHNLLGHAWILWIQDKPLELIDKTFCDSCNISEVIRCLHVGLLCVQRVPEDRPSMSSVVLMLSSGDVLPPPKQPGFYTERSVHESPTMTLPSSENNFSTTMIEAR